MLIVTNFPRFPKSWCTADGIIGETVEATDAAGFMAHSHRGHEAIFLVDDLPCLLDLASQLYFRRGPRLVAVDPVLRMPTGIKGRAAALAKRAVLRRVDLFVHYFRDLTRMQHHYRIGPSRSAFVAFKLNAPDQAAATPDPEGDYILCVGRSLRDYDTFFSAMDRLPFPGAIPTPSFQHLREHGARFTRPLAELPANVAVLPDDYSPSSLSQMIKRARVVALPILSDSLVASGISICMDALAQGKCVVLSEGPGASDVFSAGEVMTVPPEDPAALAAALRRAWEDDDLRRATGARGHAYALRQGGEPELYARMIETVVPRLAGSSRRLLQLAAYPALPK